MLMSMVRKQLYIDDDLNQGLRALAARSGMSEAEHVRAALREYLRHVPPVDDADDPLLELIGRLDPRFCIGYSDGPGASTRRSAAPLAQRLSRTAHLRLRILGAGSASSATRWWL